MAKGNKIIVNSEDFRGRIIEGIVSGTPKPGTCMQLVPATEPIEDVFTYRVADFAADGEREEVIVALEDEAQGKTADDAYVTGTRIRMAIPAIGDELNVLFNNVAGTADDVAIGDKLIIDDGTGKLNVTTGSPEDEVFKSLETLTDPTADTLIRARRI